MVLLQKMATIVAKAMAKSDKANADTKAVIEKLKAEFAPELNMGEPSNTDSRLEKLEKNISPVKMAGGDVRIRYQTNFDQKTKNTNSKSSSRIQERVRLNIISDINESVK